MTTSLIVFAVSFVIGIVQTAFWRWFSNVSDSQKAVQKDITDIKKELAEFKAELYRDYPSKSDVHKDNDRIMQSLAKIESTIEKISEKLDKKADK